MTSQDPAGRGRFAGPEYQRLLAAARRYLERAGAGPGGLAGAVTVTNPGDEERRAIIGITGQYRPEGTAKLTVRLADLDQAVREATGHGLRTLLERTGPPVRDRPAERSRLAEGRATTIRSMERSVLSGRDWFQAWLAGLTADGTLTKLVNSGESADAGRAVRVLELLDARAGKLIQLAELAAEATGDTKALNHGTSLATLVLRALALKSGTSRPATTEARRDLWDTHGVIVDDLASRVLVLNLTAEGDGLGEWLTGASARGVPFYVTLQQLVAMPVSFAAPATVHACENPAILRRAAADLGASAKPLICAEGQPSTAFHRLVTAISNAGGQLRYHGDFDWPGIGIAAAVIRRHGARPWRLGAADYRAAIAAGTDYVKLDGAPRPTPWDPPLMAAMAEAARAVYEESVATPLIDDLRGGR